jgi:hypothetical protein
LLLLGQDAGHHVPDHKHTDVGRINTGMINGLRNGIGY